MFQVDKDSIIRIGDEVEYSVVIEGNDLDSFEARCKGVATKVSDYDAGPGIKKKLCWTIEEIYPITGKVRQIPADAVWRVPTPKNAPTPGDGFSSVTRSLNQSNLSGWLCPACGKGNSPFSSQCPCPGRQHYSASINAIEHSGTSQVPHHCGPHLTDGRCRTCGFQWSVANPYQSTSTGTVETGILK